MAITIAGVTHKDRNTVEGVALIDPATTGGLQPTGQTGWTLAFSEEFAGSTVTTVDAPTGMVNFRSGGPTWQGWYTAGAAGGSGNAQHTNNPGREKEYYDLTRLSVSGGSLAMTAVKDLAHTGIGLNYTSGMATTNPSFNFLYGYVEARVRCPGVGGTWPALWLIPADYSWPPEIDMMEQFGTSTHGKTTTYLNSGGGTTGTLNLFDSSTDVVAGYQTFGMRWNSTTITFFMNGTQYAQETNTSAIPQKQMYVVVNMAIDGNQTIDDASLPASYLVDYVRVWQ